MPKIIIIIIIIITIIKPKYYGPNKAHLNNLKIKLTNLKV